VLPTFEHGAASTLVVHKFVDDRSGKRNATNGD